MGMLDVACPGCRRVLKINDDLAGRKVKCPQCGCVLTVRAPAATGSSANVAGARKAPPAAAAAEAATVAPEAAAEVERGETQTDVAPTGGGAPPSPLIDFLAPPQGPGEIGRLGPYRVLKILGAGGMGVVYRAEDPQLQRMVALKVMLPSLAASASARERFLREARAAAKVEHDHVVAIYQVGEDRGVPYLAMPLLRGESLDDRLKRERLPPAEALRIARETATGLEAARKRGLIHRDIKPANLWLEEETGRVKILDFGLARAAAGDAQLTQEGAILGTPAYMAPEQAGGTADHRADLFSLGCVLYRMATGEAPFKGTDTISTLMAVATEEPRRPNEVNPALPAALSDLIMRLLAKKPEGRPASAQAVVEAIRAIEADPTLLVARARSAAKPGPKSAARLAAPAKPALKPAAARPVAAPAPAPPKKRKRSAGLWIALGVVGLLAAATVLAIGGYLVTHPWSAPPDHSPPIPPPDDGESAWQPLLNGKDLSGWNGLRANKYNFWAVEDDVLHNKDALRNSWLITEREYSDFEFRLEYRLAEKSRAGILLRGTKDEKPTDALRVQLVDEAGYANDKPPLKPTELNGALRDLTPPSGPAARPAGEWNRLQIAVRGRQVTEKINDVIVLQTDLDRYKDQAAKFPAVLHTTGWVGLVSDTGRVEFRDIFVRPLSADREPGGFGGVVGGGVNP